MNENRPIRCGAMLRQVRERHGWGQRELAERLGASQPAISRIERDRISPTLDTLERIFNAMGETMQLGTLSLDRPAPGASNQSIAELRADYRLTPEQRLEQAAQLSEAATELAAQAEP